MCGDLCHLLCHVWSNEDWIFVIYFVMCGQNKTVALSFILSCVANQDCSFVHVWPNDECSFVIDLVMCGGPTKTVAL